jgi:peptidase M28-like protein
MSQIRHLTLFALLLPVSALAQAARPLKHTPRPTVPAITAGDLETRLYVFADDSLQGRDVGAIGNLKATDYIAREARRIGLVPAGDRGTYFQTVPVKTRSFDTTSTFAVAGAMLTPLLDYLPVGRAALDNPSLPIVYGGEVCDSAHALTPQQASGKFVVLTVPSGFRGRCGPHAAPPAKSAAAGALVVALESLPPPFHAFLLRPDLFLDDPAGSQRAVLVLLISRAATAKMFSVPLDQLRLGMTGATAGVSVRYDVQPLPYAARNVVAIVPGSDPKLKGEYVAIGAHSDHIGFVPRPVDHDSVRIWNHIVRPEGDDDDQKQATAEQQAQVNTVLAAFRARHPGAARSDSINNGADDDGSGSVALLEIAERIASLPHKPKRSILFVWHTGEEKGYFGSRFFTDHPTVPRDSIVAELQLDMVGRGGAEDETGRTKDGVPLHGGPSYLQLVGSRRVSTELGDLIETVNTAGGHNLMFDYAIDADGNPSQLYCRSDQYEYARYGIPVTFFTTGLHSDYHQVSDEPEYIDYTHMARVASLVEDVAVHVADLDHRVVVNHPKPEPDAPCSQ